MDGLLSNSFESAGILFVALIVSVATIMIFYESIKSYLAEKEVIAWKRSKDYLTDEQVTVELQKNKKRFIREMVVFSIAYYVMFFAILLGIGLIGLILLLCGSCYPRFFPWRLWRFWRH